MNKVCRASAILRHSPLTYIICYKKICLNSYFNAFAIKCNGSFKTKAKSFLGQDTMSEHKNIGFFWGRSMCLLHAAEFLDEQLHVIQPFFFWGLPLILGSTPWVSNASWSRSRLKGSPTLLGRLVGSNDILNPRGCHAPCLNIRQY